MKKESPIDFFLPRAKTEKGGRGSGHHGHAGLPGVHGGSRPSGDGLAEEVYKPTKESYAEDINGIADYLYKRGYYTDKAYWLADIEDDAGIALERMAYLASEPAEIQEFFDEDVEVTDFFPDKPDTGRVFSAAAMIGSAIYPRERDKLNVRVFRAVDGVIMAAIAYKPAAPLLGENFMHIAFMGALDRGDGLKCLEHAFSVAASYGVGVTANTVHADKITGSMLKRFGIKKESNSSYVTIPPDGVQKILKMIRRSVS